MKRFKISWEIELDAETPLDAAKEAQKWIQSKGNDWQYYVQEDGQNKDIFSVDLQEEDEDAVLPVKDYKPMIQ